MMKLARKVIAYLETADIPFSQFILTFFAVTTLRNLLEQLVFVDSDVTHLGGDLYHYYLSYICLALGFIILLRLATGEDMAKISRVVLPCFVILNIVPILDQIFFARGKHYGLGYMFPGQHDPLLPRLFTFFGPIGESGFTYGMRIEVAIVLLACCAYFSIKGLGRIKNLLFCALIYIFVFACGALPYGIKWILDLVHVPFAYTSELFIHFYILMIFVLMLVAAFLYKPNYMAALLKDFRFFRVLHYELMFAIGLALASNTAHGDHFGISIRPYEIIFIVIAIAMACMFALATNNLADIRIDAVSNRQRPTISGAIPLNVYRCISWVYLFLSFYFAAHVSVSALFCIAVFTSIYYLYSIPPLRLKRIPVLSKFFIAFNSILLLSLGFYMNDQHMNYNFSLTQFFSLIVLTTACNFIDLKDVEGDRAGGIKTLPVLIGMRSSQRIIGMAFGVSYLIAGKMFADTHVLIFAAIAGAVEFVLINRKDYREGPVFVVYLASLAFILIKLLR